MVGLTLLAAGCQRSLPRDVAAIEANVEKLQKAFGSEADAGDGSGSTEEVPTPTEFADFTGRFVLNGQPPAMPVLPISGSDAAYCAPGGNAPRSEEVVVGADNGLVHVLVYLDMNIPEEWHHESYADTRELLLAGEQGFDQKGCVFLSHVFAMRSTQQVEIINSDTVSHNTNIAASGRAKTSNDILPAESTAVYQPGGASRGPFPVTCNIHPWMKAYMSVHDNPYFAVTDNEGRFEIKNVPAGVELNFRVWQERLGSNLENVTINDAPAKWSKGRFKLQLEPGATEEWNIVVDAAEFQ